jgi:hypothetical protein
MSRFVSTLVTVIWAFASHALAANLAPNGSFEETGDTPQRWHSNTGFGRVATDKPHHGKRYLSAKSTGELAVWQSDVAKLESCVELRVEGWLRCGSGKARLGVERLDEHGKVIDTTWSPIVTKSPDWRYVAAETDGRPATKVRVVFSVDGDADLDEVYLAPISITMLGNKGIEIDAPPRRNRPPRILMWDQVNDDALVPDAKRGGDTTASSEFRHEGKRSVAVKARTGESWCAIGSLTYGTPGWTKKLRLHAWARCEKLASAQLAAKWRDDYGKKIRVDLSPERTGEEWQEINSIVTVPSGALDIQLCAVARRGTVWFDDFSLTGCRPDTPEIKVFVNQVGYDVDLPKSAVVATNFFPSETPVVTVELRDGAGRVHDRRQIICSGRIHPAEPDDWGWYFWRADFSSFRKPGGYRILATAAPTSTTTARGESPPILIAPDCLLTKSAPLGVDFFFVQRCGFDVPGWHKACHLDDVTLPNGKRIDATGGWHSAGDYNKPMFPFGDSAAFYALATLFDEHSGQLEHYDRDHDGVPDALDEAMWGARFCAKMQNPAAGYLYGDIMQGPGRTWSKWSIPDIHTDNKFGTADDPVINPDRPIGATPLAIAGWARLAQVLNARGTANDYHERAAKLWTYFTEGKPAAKADPMLLLGALEIHSLTQQIRHKEFADSCVDELIRLQSQRKNGSYPGDSGDHGDWAAAALARFGLQYPSDPRQNAIRESLTKYMEFCYSRVDNPFGLSRQGMPNPGQSALYFHPSVGLGVNFWILGRAWAAALIHRLYHDPRALVYAVDQIDWVFGKNTYGLCMFEGKGVLNPPRYHHRYNQIPGHPRGAVPGCIPNGFVADLGLADRPGFNMTKGPGRSPSHRTNEPWLCHNITHLLAVSALSHGESRRPGTVVEEKRSTLERDSTGSR